jgi:hypothetical protein
MRGRRGGGYRGRGRGRGRGKVGIIQENAADIGIKVLLG